MEKGLSMDVSRSGLEFNPFLKNSEEILVETTQYKEALFRLTYLEKPKASACSQAGRGVERHFLIAGDDAVASN